MQFSQLLFGCLTLCSIGVLSALPAAYGQSGSYETSYTGTMKDIETAKDLARYEYVIDGNSSNGTVRYHKILRSTSSAASKPPFGPASSERLKPGKGRIKARVEFNNWVNSGGRSGKNDTGNGQPTRPAGVDIYIRPNDNSEPKSWIGGNLPQDKFWDAWVGRTLTGVYTAWDEVSSTPGLADYVIKIRRDGSCTATQQILAGGRQFKLESDRFISALNAKRVLRFDDNGIKDSQISIRVAAGRFIESPSMGNFRCFLADRQDTLPKRLLDHYAHLKTSDSAPRL